MLFLLLYQFYTIHVVKTNKATDKIMSIALFILLANDNKFLWITR